MVVQEREALGEAVVAILHLDAFRIDVERVVKWDEGSFVGGDEEGGVEGVGEEAGFEAGEAQEVVLSEGDAFDGEDFL